MTITQALNCTMIGYLKINRNIMAQLTLITILGTILFDIAFILGLIYYFVDWKSEIHNSFHPNS